MREKLSVSQARILFELLDHPGGMTISGIAQRLLLLTPDVTAACNILACRNFINRDRSHADRRSILIDITSDGFALIRRLALAADTLMLKITPHLGREARLIYLKAARLMVAAERQRFRAE
jgi:DNA-binding MarR family transcriptional regulator